jgi:hypothetical protein
MPVSTETTKISVSHAQLRASSDHFRNLRDPITEPPSPRRPPSLTGKAQRDPVDPSLPAYEAHQVFHEQNRSAGIG